jgi:hypothetical protein
MSIYLVVNVNTTHIRGKSISVFSSILHPLHQGEIQETPRRPSFAGFLLSAQSHPRSSQTVPRTQARPPHCEVPRNKDVLGTI